MEIFSNLHLPSGTLLLIFAAVYFILVFWLSKSMTRRITTMKDYFLAGRRLGAVPVALSFVASWFGAASTIGSVNAYYRDGVSALWQLAIPSVFSCLVIVFFIARKVSDQNTLSQPEAIEHHYGRTGRFLLSWIILAMATTFIGSQLVAAGKLCQGTLGMDLLTSTCLVTALVVLYSTVGGYFAVVITDICQFVLFTTAILILAVYVLFQGGNPVETIAQAVVHHPAAYWDLTQGFWHNMALLVTFVLAWCIAPEMWQRMSSTPNREMAYRAAGIATCCLLGLFFLVAIIGLMSGGLVQNNDNVLVSLAYLLPHESLTALVLVGIMAAITSTMDSSLNVGSLTLTKDLYQGFIRPNASEGELIWIGRLATMLIPIPAICIALNNQDIIQVLWISADIYASTMFFPVIGLLYLKQPGHWSGVLAMIFGGLSILFSALVQSHLIDPPFYWPGWPYSTLIGVSMSGLGFAIGYALSRKKAEIAPAKSSSVLTS